MKPFVRFPYFIIGVLFFFGFEEKHNPPRYRKNEMFSQINSKKNNEAI
tara:strand:+ start:1114 stop:1257 length:144 start_codon:yes stop_codon:yes gene_type:complete